MIEKMAVIFKNALVKVNQKKRDSNNLSDHLILGMVARILDDGNAIKLLKSNKFYNQEELIVRRMLETYLYLRYLTVDKGTAESKAKNYSSFVKFNLISRSIAQALRGDNSTNHLMRLFHESEKEEIQLPLKEYVKSKTGIKLSCDQEALNYILKHKDKFIKDDTWYKTISVSGKHPGDLSSLADNFKETDLYNHLYRFTSNYVHSSDILDSFSKENPIKKIDTKVENSAKDSIIKHGIPYNPQETSSEFNAEGLMVKVLCVLNDYYPDCGIQLLLEKAKNEFNRKKIVSK